ncbi:MULTISPECIES: hypothetical protein [Rhodococcus]|uniref:hypothetical protein n=1 Tax=Rhodococcus TaxID=1827 RepID=UPI0002FDE182|nr:MULTISPECIES: hypothetical protein [Rhodococcus]KPH21666.1 hypothetical protein AN948_00470 [Rhodococcus sp. ADH]MBS2993600.1 hypothetical protein [Rhodococcus erythropolis]MCJ0901740.1 hypothetical protein [Rhodococcus sp. ARC_M13]MCJ0950655.1 hypothetical protein [Rhodococcus sp. ARC_M8]MDJ0435212.1 hypothetical protein [Rhodococcus qingshengii]
MDDPLTLDRYLFSCRPLGMSNGQLSFKIRDPLDMVKIRAAMTVGTFGRAGSVRNDSSSDEVFDSDRPAFIGFDRTRNFAGFNSPEQRRAADACPFGRLGQ